MRDQKGFAPVIAVFIVLLVGVAGFVIYRYSSIGGNSKQLSLDTKQEKLEQFDSSIESEDVGNPNEAIKYSNKLANISFVYPGDFVKEDPILEADEIFSASNGEYRLRVKAIYSSENYFYREIDEIADAASSGDEASYVTTVEGLGEMYVHSVQAAGGAYSFFHKALIDSDTFGIEISLSPKDEDNVSETIELGDKIFASVESYN